MAGRKWLEPELRWFFENPRGDHSAFRAAGFTRTYNAWRMKREELELGHAADVPSLILGDNSREAEINWREWNDPIRQLQGLRKKAKGSLDGEAMIQVAANEPVAFIVLGDTHIGAWSSDHDLFALLTDEILAVPNLYIALMGDLAHMAIKLRGVTEVGDNLLPADLQLLYLHSWLLEVQERVLFATWGNHEVERAEAQAGLNPFGDLYRKSARHYFNGIGHLTVRVNEIDYKIAATHKFLNRSEINPCHGQVKYAWKQGMDRDILIAGDSHTPGILEFTQGRDLKLAVNCGSSQSWSGYAQRYFSLYTHPTFPVVTLHHEVKEFGAYWSLGQYLRQTGQRVSHTFAA